MPVPPQRPSSRGKTRTPAGHAPRARRGFALLITITLLAFLVLLLVSLASLTRVETQVASNTRQLAQARQSALLGLNIALGRLQQLTGPDQRVTATADVLANRHEDRKRWTGVWNADPASGARGDNIGWLVSGADPAGTANVNSEVTADADEELITLVGAGSVDADLDGEPVRVPTESLRVQSVPGLATSASGHKTGAFAYWIGDEGVKAKISLVDPHAEEPADERLYSFMSAQRNAGEVMTLANGTAVGDAYPRNDENLHRVLSHPHLPLVATGSVPQAALRALTRDRFHDLAFHARSVPANVATGGLKKDLSAWLSSSTPASGAPADNDFIIGAVSAADSATDRLPRWGLVRSYAGLTSGTTHTPRPQTDTQMGLYPVLTYVKVGINVSCEGDDQPLKVHLFPEVVLWNPYNVPIDVGPCLVGFRFSGTVEFVINGAVKTRLNFTRAALGVTGTWPPDYFRLALDVASPIPPGESVMFTPPFDEAPYDPANPAAAALRAENPINRGGSLVMTGPLMTAAEREQNITWNIATNGQAYMALWPAGSTMADTNDAWQTISQIGHGGVAAPTPQPAPEAVLGGRLQYRFQATMSRGVTTHTTPRWIAQQNMRSPIIERSGAETGSLPLVYCVVHSGATLPNITVDGNRAGAGLSVSRVAGSADRLALYELRPPDVPFFSLAELQHANLAPAGYYPGYAVGNSLPAPAIPLGDIARKAGGWARGVHDLSYQLNTALWDRYFFSTIPAGLSQSDLDDATHPLPNARHVFVRAGGLAPAAVAGAGAFHSAAAHLWIDGGFNVNSTSVEAWKALLASRNGLRYDPVNRAAGGPELEYPFSRYTVPLGGSNQPWEGYRTLSPGAIDLLARRIVEQVKARGPFLSLADFVNRRLADNPATSADERYAGTLQAALDAHDLVAGLPAADRINLMDPFDAAADAAVSAAGTSWDVNIMRGGDTTAFPRSSRSVFAPGYLSQADILNAIGPVLTPRSDTFVIRAYGDVRNPVTGRTEGKAWCEAVVQRLHSFVNAADSAETWPVTNPENASFGRRYSVISFRWLNPEEI